MTPGTSLIVSACSAEGLLAYSNGIVRFIDTNTIMTHTNKVKYYPIPVPVYHCPG